MEVIGLSVSQSHTHTPLQRALCSYRPGPLIEPMQSRRRYKSALGGVQIEHAGYAHTLRRYDGKGVLHDSADRFYNNFSSMVLKFEFRPSTMELNI